MTSTKIVTSDKARRHVERELSAEIAPEKWDRFARTQSDIGQRLANRRLYVEDDLPRLVERFRECAAKK